MNQEVSGLVQRILNGEVRAAGRLMRLIDDRSPKSGQYLDELYPHTGNATFIGITGNPGSGKSTLVDQMIKHFRQRGHRVGCLAVDPTSPFSGGAILGDRVRMQEHALDKDVYIRSIATRGHLGGISRSTPAMMMVLDAMGFDIILIETVGVGQAEVDIVSLADTSIVVMVPGLGDDIQANKAGIMEIADIFVINKSDRDGHQRLKREIRTMLNLVPQEEGQWRAPIVNTIATTGEGLDDVLVQIDKHQHWLGETTDAPQKDIRRAEHFLRLSVNEQIQSRLDTLMNAPAWSAVQGSLTSREYGPNVGAQKLLAMLEQALSEQ